MIYIVFDFKGSSAYNKANISRSFMSLLTLF